MHLDRDRSLGSVNRDGHLIVDPTQAVLIVDLSPTFRDPQVLLILQTQTLIERTCSMHTATYVHWNEWGRRAVVMETPPSGIDFATIHGARVLVITSTRHRQRDDYRIHTFDFSRRGGVVPPLLEGNDGGVERRIAFGDGGSCSFLETGEGIGSWGIHSLGDCVVFRIVSLRSCPVREDIVD